MNAQGSLPNLFQAPVQQESVLAFGINFAIAVVLSTTLGYLYQRHGKSQSDKLGFSKLFVILTVTTMLVITIVKSSLALSLGLVGALSIVRFRSAIKEPEELIFLFLAIALGLGLGAGQRLITVVGACLTFGVIAVRGFLVKEKDSGNFFLTLSTNPESQPVLERVTELLKRSCQYVALKRVDEDNQSVEATFSITVTSLGKIESLRKELREFGNDFQYSLIENKGLVG